MIWLLVHPQDWETIELLLTLGAIVAVIAGGVAGWIYERRKARDDEDNGKRVRDLEHVAIRTDARLERLEHDQDWGTVQELAVKVAALEARGKDDE